MFKVSIPHGRKNVSGDGFGVRVPTFDREVGGVARERCAGPGGVSVGAGPLPEIGLK